MTNEYQDTHVYKGEIIHPNIQERKQIQRECSLDLALVNMSSKGQIAKSTKYIDFETDHVTLENITNYFF